MDELAVLRDFRLEDAVPTGAREHARAALRSAQTRQRRRRRRITIAAAFVGAAIVAGAAYGLVRELVVGDPAPAEVRAQVRFAHSAELIPVPHPDDPQLQDATVGAVLDSSIGRVYLFASKNARGPCISTWVEGERGYQGRLSLVTGCGSGTQTTALWSQRSSDGRELWILAGQVPEGVARVVFRVGERRIELPLSRRWFLAEIPAPPEEFTTYDRAGAVSEHRDIPNLHDRPREAARPPHQITRVREVASVDARNGAETVRLFVARASDGGYCQIVRADRTRSNRTCSIAPPKQRELNVSAMNLGGAPGGILLMVGIAGDAVETLELRYEDGRVAELPLHDHWALYEVDPADYAAGRRPEALVGRDAAGREIVTKPMPWSRVSRSAARP